MTNFTETSHQEVLDFYRICEEQVANLLTYPTREPLSEVYWRSMFLDYKRKLPAERGAVFEEYLNLLLVNGKLLSQTAIEIKASFSNTPLVICFIGTLLLWIFSRALRTGNFIPILPRTISWLLLWPCAILTLDYIFRIGRFLHWR
jgi:hypothetical protein